MQKPIQKPLKAIKHFTGCLTHALMYPSVDQCRLPHILCISLLILARIILCTRLYPKTQNRNITIVTSVHPHHKHHIAWLEKWHIILLTHIASSLVPRPRPAFHRLQCSTASDGKLGGAWEQGYIASVPIHQLSSLMQHCTDEIHRSKRGNSSPAHS